MKFIVGYFFGYGRARYLDWFSSNFPGRRAPAFFFGWPAGMIGHE